MYIKITNMFINHNVYFQYCNILHTIFYPKNKDEFGRSTKTTQKLEATVNKPDLKK